MKVLVNACFMAGAFLLGFGGLIVGLAHSYDRISGLTCVISMITSVTLGLSLLMLAYQMNAKERRVIGVINK